MKNIIYLTLIAVLFSGCVGNSFRTQRYTNFKHSAKHRPDNCQTFAKVKTNPEPQVISNCANTEAIPITVSKIGDEPIVAHANPTNNSKKNNHIFPKPVIKELVKEQAKPHEFKKAQTAGKKGMAAKGLIGAALRLVVLVVVLAIVVGIIILVILL